MYLWTWGIYTRRGYSLLRPLEGGKKKAREKTTVLFQKLKKT